MFKKLWGVVVASTPFLAAVTLVLLIGKGAAPETLERTETRFSQSIGPKPSNSPGTVRPGERLACVSVPKLIEMMFDKRVVLFTAPNPLKPLPISVARWEQALEGRGALVLFSDGRHFFRNMTVVCVEHTEDGYPRVDSMHTIMDRIDNQGVVGYFNSDVEAEDIGQFFKTIDVLNSQNLELYATVSPYSKFLKTNLHTSLWFAVVCRINVKAGKRTKHTKGGVDLWFWNKLGNSPLLTDVKIPPFRFPMATYDNWLVDIVTQRGERNVIDVSSVVTILHDDHPRKNGFKTWGAALHTGLTSVFINRQLGFIPVETKFDRNIRHQWQFGTSYTVPYTIEPAWIITRRDIWGDCRTLPPHCSVEESEVCVLVDAACIDATIKSTAQNEHMARVQITNNEAREGFSDIVQAAARNWRYTLETQLHEHRRNLGAQDLVIVSGATYNYRTLLANFVCNMKRLMVVNFVIAAFDPMIYRWGGLHGYPMFKHYTKRYVEEEGVDFGSDEFKETTKLKSAVVLEVLRAGVSVIWCDVDIVWFKDPFDALASSLSSENIVVQSNAPYFEDGYMHNPHPTLDLKVRSEPLSNGIRRINSGLYYARSTPAVIAAFEEIVADAASSPLSEQPSFDDVLCGAAGNRHENYCVYAASVGMLEVAVNVSFLDRLRFPTGAVKVGHPSKNVFELGHASFSELARSPVYSVHNNWIKGQNEKINRQRAAGYWFIADDFCFMG